MERERHWLEKKLKSRSTTRKAGPNASAPNSIDLGRSLREAREATALEHRLQSIERQRKAQTERQSSALASRDGGDDEVESFLREVGDYRPTPGAMSAVISTVWYCPPKKVGEKQRLLTVGVESFSDNPLGNLPSKAASMEYARMIEENRLAQIQEEARQKQQLEDQQQEIVAKNRARKTAALRAAKERVKAEIDARNAFKTSWAADRARRLAEVEQKAARIAKAKEEAEALELLRIRDIKSTKLAQEKQQAEDYAMQLELEKAIISKIADDQEAQEIVRRIKEEERMRYLEERRRQLDAREEERRLLQAAKESEKHAKAVEEANRAQARLRKGNFVWHNGKLGFYDNVRKGVPEYVQYEDYGGNAYYYDPVYGTNQYRQPEDTNVHHHTDDERRAYDEVHGEGAYDAHRAEIAFKDSVNQYGGYYNEAGQWVVANGYYDEAYNWVEYEGYYDEKGKYIRYAKVSGDLTFMV